MALRLQLLRAMQRAASRGDEGLRARVQPLRLLLGLEEVGSRVESSRSVGCGGL